MARQTSIQWSKFPMTFSNIVVSMALISVHEKKYVAGTKKHIAVPAILLTILTINMSDIT